MTPYQKVIPGDFIEGTDGRIYKVISKASTNKRWRLKISYCGDNLILPATGIQRIIGQSIKNIENELEDIYKKYYSDECSFEDMVQKFALDDFYKGHEIAKKYLELKNVKEQK